MDDILKLDINKRCPLCNCKVSKACVISDKKNTMIIAHCSKCGYDTAVNTFHFVITDRKVMYNAIDETFKKCRKAAKERNNI